MEKVANSHDIANRLKIDYEAVLNSLRQSLLFLEA